MVVERDLKAARNCLFGPEPTEEAAAYHCQQAAEKLIKAALIGNGVNAPCRCGSSYLREAFSIMLTLRKSKGGRGIAPDGLGR